MQRRVFDVDGRPHVVSRDGLYFETYATLAPAIADFVTALEPALAPIATVVVPSVVAPPPAAAMDPVVGTADVIVMPEHGPEDSLDDNAAAVPAETEVEAAPKRPVRRRTAKLEGAEPGAEPRRPTRRRTMADRAEELFAAPAPAPAPPPAPVPAEAEAGGQAPHQNTLSLPVDDSEQGLEAAARRRMRVTEAPRWQVAGALRRGRQPRA